MRIRADITTGRIALGVLSGIFLIAFAVLWTRWSGTDETEQISSARTPVYKSRDWDTSHAWQATVGYARGSGTIEVDLRNKDVEDDAGMKVRANFKSAHGGKYGGANWLTRGSDGIFRSSEVDLPKGQWTLGLTGYDKSRFTFRIEKTLVVE